MAKSTEFQKWWADNGDAYNKIRRERYAASAGLREKAKKQARTYRKTHAPRKSPMSAKGLFTASQVAQDIARTPAVFASWEKAKLIPVQKVNGQRYYTAAQVHLLNELAIAMEYYHVDRDSHENKLADVKARIKNEWGKLP